MTTVLVTGVTGSVGQVLADRLAESGLTVRAASRRPLASMSYGETAIMPPLDASTDAFLALVDGVDHVVHAAALTNVDRRASEDDFMKANADLSAALAEAAARIVPGRFVFLSSIRAIAGAGNGGTIGDDSPPRPADPYGRSKRAAEIAVTEAFSRAGTPERLVILRPAPVYGKGMKGALAGMLRLADTPFPLPFGAFDNRRSLLSVDALAEATLHLIQTNRPVGPHFVVSDRAPVSIAAIFRAFRRGLHRPARLIKVPKDMMTVAARLAGRDDAWKRLLAEEICDPSGLIAAGWRPVDSQEGLEKLAHAMKNGR